MTLTIISLFLIGLCFGSFASVLLTRLDNTIDWKTIKGIFIGFSRCPKCKKRLKVEHLIPLVSFFIQKGKCIHCKKKIHRIYPVLELGSGFIFVGSFLFTYFKIFPQFPVSSLINTTIFWIIVNWLLFSLLIYDVKVKYLHMPIRIISVLVILLPQFLGLIGNYRRAVIASLTFGALFYLIYFAAKYYMQRKYKQKIDGIGEGDVFLAFLIGALISFVFIYHGLSFTPMIITEIFLLFIILSGAVGLLRAGIEFGIKKLQKKKIKGSIKLQEIAFLPAMIISFWILLWQANVIVFTIFPPLG